MPELKIFLLEIEVNELVEGELAYGGCKSLVVLARDEKQAERLMDKHLARKEWSLEPDGQYCISTIPRRPGVTEVG